MRSIPQRIALGVWLVLLATPAPAVSQPRVGGPTVAPAQGAVPSGTPLATTEQSIAQEYAKLIQEAMTQQAALRGQIEALDEKIEALKQQASRIQLIAQKTEQVLPKILSALGRDSGGKEPASAVRQARDPGAVIAGELAKVGVTASAGELRWLVEAIGHGGPGAGGRVQVQAMARFQRANIAIDSTRDQIAQLRAQIVALDQQIAKLQKQRDEALAALEKQQKKASEEARKRRATSAAPTR
jgi:transposase